MRLEDIKTALVAASRISRQHEFVIAGSLSVLGFIDVPPELMAMSIDIDFFPLRNPHRAGEIVSLLGEDSAFHERHGFYLDPISPELPVLPGGWRERLQEVRLGSVTAFFLDVNDTAISKYARSAENDFRWLDTGLEHNILTLDTIQARARFSTNFPLPEDKFKTVNGIQAHRSAMRPDGHLDAGLLAVLRSMPEVALQEVDPDDGAYVGKILWRNDSFVVQSVERGKMVVHKANVLSTDVTPDMAPIIRYQNGKAVVTLEKARNNELLIDR